MHDGQPEEAGSLTSWRLFFDAPPLPPDGLMEVARTHANGGTFTSQFNVLPRFTFTNRDTENIRVLDSAVVGFQPLLMQMTGDSRADWVHQPFIPLEVCGAPPAADRNFFPGVHHQEQGAEEPLACPVAVTHGGRACVGHCHKVAVHQVPGACSGACCLPNFECRVVDAVVTGNAPAFDIVTARQKCVDPVADGGLGGKYMGDESTCDDADADGLADVFETNIPLRCCGQPPSAWIAGTDANNPDTDGDSQCDGCELRVLGTLACSNGVPMPVNPVDVPDCDTNGFCCDCNTNGLCDRCEIFGLRTPSASACPSTVDCNSNGVPDECEPRIRKNYCDLSPCERRKFRDALVAMKRDTDDTGSIRECTAPEGSVGRICTNGADCGEGGVCNPAPSCEWTNKYDKYVCWHDRCGCLSEGGDQHHRPRVLPWHRELFRRFEEDIRAKPGFENVTIPYWKWTEPFPSHLDDGVGDNNFMGSTNAGYFFDVNNWRTRPGGPGGDVLRTRAHASAVGNINQNDIDAALARGAYDAPNGPLPGGWLHLNPDRGFRPDWERLHDNMHIWVGGDHGEPPSALDDPIAWLSHAYWDYGWATWEVSYDPDYRPDTANYPADAPTPPGEDADDVMAPWDEKTIRDVLSIQDLGYSYDTNGAACP